MIKNHFYKFKIIMVRPILLTCKKLNTTPV